MPHPLVVSGLAVGGWNLAGFTATALTGSHKLTDITGTSAFTVSALASLGLLASKRGVKAAISPRPLMLSVCVTAWAARLGGYLFDRIRNSHEDPRLKYMFRKDGEPMLTGPSRFPLKLLNFWSIQALWAWTSMLPVTMAIAAAGDPKKVIRAAPKSISSVTLGLGLIGFSTGFLVETLADRQKSQFKSDVANPRRDKWCDQGLWSISQYPNYLGEMTVWWSLFLMAQPVAPVWTVASPVFVTFLLTRVSGIPLMEKRYDRKYGNDEEFKQYKATTPMLLPSFASVMKYVKT